MSKLIEPTDIFKGYSSNAKILYWYFNNYGFRKTDDQLWFDQGWKFLSWKGLCECLPPTNISREDVIIALKDASDHMNHPVTDENIGEVLKMIKSHSLPNL